MIFSTLWVNCKNKFQTFFKIFTKKIALSRTYMTYLPRFKRIMPDLLCKVKRRKNLFRQILQFRLHSAIQILQTHYFRIFQPQKFIPPNFPTWRCCEKFTIKKLISAQPAKWTESRSHSKLHYSIIIDCLLSRDFVVYSLKAEVVYMDISSVLG